MEEYVKRNERVKQQLLKRLDADRIRDDAEDAKRAQQVPIATRCKNIDTNAKIDPTATPNYAERSADSTNALKAGIAGTAVATVSLDSSGTVTHVTLTRSSGNAALDAVVLDEAAGSRFTPKIENCKQTPGSFVYVRNLNYRTFDGAELNVSSDATLGIFKSHYLGAALESLNALIGRQLGFDQPGVVIDAVTAGGPADEAQLHRRDVIQKINGQSVATSAEIAKIVSEASVGSTLTLQVWRDGNINYIPVTLQNRPPGLKH